MLFLSGGADEKYLVEQATRSVLTANNEETGGTHAHDGEASTSDVAAPPRLTTPSENLDTFPAAPLGPTWRQTRRNDVNRDPLAAAEAISFGCLSSLVSCK